MINIKYYVFLMVGIFLSIGLGMMIGITLENQNIIENQQTQLIHQIENYFVTLQSETEELKLELNNVMEQNNQLHDFSSLLLDEITYNKLTGVCVGVITFSEQGSLSELLDYLKFTGVSVQSAVTLLPNSFFESDTSTYAMQQPDEFVITIIQELVYSMNYGKATPLILEAEDILIQTQMFQYQYPVDIIILLGQGTPTLVYDNILIGKAKAAGITVVAVETSQTEDSGVSEYKAWEISSVDHVDSLYGKLALASVLSGQTGNYGFEEEAMDPLPNPLFNEDESIHRQAIITNEGDKQ